MHTKNASKTPATVPQPERITPALSYPALKINIISSVSWFSKLTLDFTFSAQN